MLPLCVHLTSSWMKKNHDKKIKKRNKLFVTNIGTSTIILAVKNPLFADPKPLLPRSDCLLWSVLRDTQPSSHCARLGFQRNPLFIGAVCVHLQAQVYFRRHIWLLRSYVYVQYIPSDWKSDFEWRNKNVERINLHWGLNKTKRIKLVCFLVTGEHEIYIVSTWNFFNVLYWMQKGTA